MLKERVHRFQHGVEAFREYASLGGWDDPQECADELGIELANVNNFYWETTPEDGLLVSGITIMACHVDWIDAVVYVGQRTYELNICGHMTNEDDGNTVFVFPDEYDSQCL